MDLKEIDVGRTPGDALFQDPIGRFGPGRLGSIRVAFDQLDDTALAIMRLTMGLSAQFVYELAAAA